MGTPPIQFISPSCNIHSIICRSVSNLSRISSKLENCAAAEENLPLFCAKSRKGEGWDEGEGKGGEIK
jgi:hypothetical protein